MSLFDAQAARAIGRLYAHFGDRVTVTRGALSVEVDAVIESGVEIQGKENQITQRVNMVSFRNDQWQPESLDVVTLPDGSTKQIDEVHQNDGRITRVILYG